MELLKQAEQYNKNTNNEGVKKELLKVHFIILRNT